MVQMADNTLVDEDVGYIDGIINDFNGKLAEFDRLVTWFKTQENVAKSDAVLNQEYTELMHRAELLQGTIDKAKDSINQLTNMVTNMTPDWLKSWLNDTNGDHLGLVPLLVAGAITGAIAWLGVWITDAYIVAQKLEAQKVAIAAGADPTRTTEALFTENGTGGAMFGLGSIGTLGLLLLAGGAVYFYNRYYG